jgi:hypothetical protein
VCIPTKISATLQTAESAKIYHGDVNIITDSDAIQPKHLVSANAEETRLIFECAKKHNKIAMEAFHWQFHPAADDVHALISSGKYGKVLSTYARMTTPTGSIPSSDIWWQFDLAGGSLMDMTYVVSRYATFWMPVRQMKLHPPKRGR